MVVRSHVGWGFLLSLLLHAAGIAILSLAPRLNVRPGVVRHVDFAVLSEGEEAPGAPNVPKAPAAAAPPARPDEPEVASALVEVAEDARASIEVTPAPEVAPAPVAAPKPVRKAPAKPLSAAAPTPQPVAAVQPRAAMASQLPSSSRADPRSDGSALERVLKRIASTTQLTQDERRRAMLMVLRTWEDPSGRRSAEELVDALIQNTRRDAGAN